MIDNNDFSQTVTSYFKNDYRERGKIKWNGYFLSDHTSSLKHDSNERHTVTTKLEQMPLNEMKDQLQFALVNYRQLETLIDVLGMFLVIRHQNMNLSDG